MTHAESGRISERKGWGVAGFWADLPLDRPIIIEGVSTDVLALSIEPLPIGAPAIITYTAEPGARAARMVANLLAQLDRIARELFPAWLPEAEQVDSDAGAGVLAVRSIALRSGQYGSFLADLAERALRRRPRPTRRFSPEVRAAGLATALAASFGRARAAILIRMPEGLPAEDQQAIVTTAQWLVDNGHFGSWLSGAAPAAMDAVECVVFTPPAHDDLLVDEPDRAEEATLGYPALAGRPHPASRAEQLLEAALCSADWATGRAWNQHFQPHPLTNPIRLDLLWQDERCVVEIDGAEHCQPTRFAADRQRDVLLQLAGYAVLRFTNQQVLQHRDLVLSQIRQFLECRRATNSKGATHARSEAITSAAGASAHPHGGER